jgi:hypothetical protein
VIGPNRTYLPPPPVTRVVVDSTAPLSTAIFAVLPIVSLLLCSAVAINSDRLYFQFIHNIKLRIQGENVINLRIGYFHG